MKKIAVFFGTGYEEIEALTVVDICRRCGLEVETVLAVILAVVLVTAELAVRLLAWLVWFSFWLHPAKAVHASIKARRQEALLTKFSFMMIGSFQ